jgi:4,5-dihydroxyphthalate decarboxylase
MMLKGEVAAALMGVDLPKDPCVRPLVPDPHKAAQEWFEREGVVPINSWQRTRRTAYSAKDQSTGF